MTEKKIKINLDEFKGRTEEDILKEMTDYLAEEGIGKYVVFNIIPLNEDEKDMINNPYYFADDGLMDWEGNTHSPGILHKHTIEKETAGMVIYEASYTARSKDRKSGDFVYHEAEFMFKAPSEKYGKAIAESIAQSLIFDDLSEYNLVKNILFNGVINYTIKKK